MEQIGNLNFINTDKNQNENVDKIVDYILFCGKFKLIFRDEMNVHQSLLFSEGYSLEI